MAGTMSQQPKAPQPAIIAPSREDILSNLAFFFGDPSSPEKLRDYSEHQAATYHFPGTRLNSNPCRLSCVFSHPSIFPLQTRSTARTTASATP